MPVLGRPVLGKWGVLQARAAQALSARDAAVLGAGGPRQGGLLAESSNRVCGAAGCAGGWARP